MAAAGLSIKIRGNELKKIRGYLTKLAARGELEKGIRRGTALATQYMLSDVVERIKNGKYKKLASLTLLMRRSEGHGSIPLLKKGRLIRAMSTDVVTPYRGRVGLLAGQRASSGRATFARIGPLLHDGGVVHIKYKAWVRFMRFLAYKGILKKDDQKETIGRAQRGVNIRIPPRPFIKNPFNDRRNIAKIRQAYIQGIRKAIEG